MKIEITKAPNLLTNGFVKTSGGDGTLIVDPTGGGGSPSGPVLGPLWLEPEEPEIPILIPGRSVVVYEQATEPLSAYPGDFWIVP